MERLTSTGRCWTWGSGGRGGAGSTWGGGGCRRSPGRGGGRGGGVHVGGGQGVEVLVRWVHGSGAAAGAQVVARGADLSQVRERERQGTRCFFG
jgi:hypothetical protein